MLRRKTWEEGSIGRISLHFMNEGSTRWMKLDQNSRIEFAQPVLFPQETAEERALRLSDRERERKIEMEKERERLLSFTEDKRGKKGWGGKRDWKKVPYRWDSKKTKRVYDSPYQTFPRRLPKK